MFHTVNLTEATVMYSVMVLLGSAGAWMRREMKYWELGSGDDLDALHYPQVNGVLSY